MDYEQMNILINQLFCGRRYRVNPIMILIFRLVQSDPDDYSLPGNHISLESGSKLSDTEDRDAYRNFKPGLLQDF